MYQSSFFKLVPAGILSRNIHHVHMPKMVGSKVNQKSGGSMTICSGKGLRFVHLYTLYFTIFTALYLLLHIYPSVVVFECR